MKGLKESVETEVHEEDIEYWISRVFLICISDIISLYRFSD